MSRVAERGQLMRKPEIEPLVGKAEHANHVVFSAYTINKQSDLIKILLVISLLF